MDCKYNPTGASAPVSSSLINSSTAGQAPPFWGGVCSFIIAYARIEAIVKEQIELLAVLDLLLKAPPRSDQAQQAQRS